MKLRRLLLASPCDSSSFSEERRRRVLKSTMANSDDHIQPNSIPLAFNMTAIA